MESLIGSGFESAINQLPCNLVNNFTTSEEQCNFIKINECLEEEALDYVYFNYCIMGSEFKYLSIIIIIFILSIFFLTLGTIADEFLCPSLLTIAKNLRMSENLAGITLLAFGNGASDIFSSLAAASSGKAELIVSELLGAGIFCLSIVAGLIFIKQDFRLAYRPLLRDTIFYLFAVYFIWFICWNQQITLYYALAFILIYVIYLTVALGGQAIHLRLQQKKQQKIVELASGQEKIPTIAVRIHDYDGNHENKNDINNNNNYNEQDKRRLSIDPPNCDKENEASDWDDFSDWFVQSHDSMRRRRKLSQIKLSTREDEDRALLHGKSLGEPKYGLNQHVTQIRVDYKPESIANENQTNDHKNLQSNSKNDEILSNEKSALAKKLYLPAYLNPTFENISKTESRNRIEPDDKSKSGDNITKNDKFSQIGQDKKLYLTQQLDLENNNISDSLSSKKLSFSSDNDSHKNIASADRMSISFNDWDNLLTHINPLQLGDWAGANLFRKIITILRSPLIFIAICTIPVVDHDKKGNNWCRLLNIFHCISIPLTLLVNHELTSSQDSKMQPISDFGSFIQHYYSIALFVTGLILALYMLKSTKTDRPPKYYFMFSYVGFVMSILWVYTLVTEILGVLKTIGIIFSMSDTTIGLAFLAWGNSLGDIVANMALAEAGYPRMAIGACVGAPLLNLLIGFGVSFAVNLSPGEILTIEYTPTITLLCVSLAIVILSLMLCTLVPPNYSKRPFGYVLIAAYFIYLVLAISLEFELIKFN